MGIWYWQQKEQRIKLLQVWYLVKWGKHQTSLTTISLKQLVIEHFDIKKSLYLQVNDQEKEKYSKLED